jgi:glycosyltransferase involved in cell wall biosynthesis
VSRSAFVAVVPAFRCARTVGAVVAGAREFVERVVVVDDGSDDATGEAARTAGAEVIRLERNRGKGFALRAGVARALEHSPAAVALLDADGQHDPRDLPEFLRAWDASRPDLIIGCRLQDRESIPGARYWTNYIGSRVLSWMTGLDLLDSQSGYRMLAADLAGRLELASDGYAIESEMLIKAGRLGARIAHVRVRTIYNDGGSHFRPVADTFRISCASVYFKVFDDRGR